MAKEKILKIEETTFDKESGWGGKEGYVITTTKQKIMMGIDDYQSCCENWGYFMSEDDIQSFVGKYIRKIEVVETLLKKNTEFDVDDMYEGDVMFINIDTTGGLLQFVAYNEHNGYYGHEAVVKSTFLNHEVNL